MNPLADHARRGAQEAADLLYRVRRVKTGYEAREPSDARDRAIAVVAYVRGRREERRDARRREMRGPRSLFYDQEARR